MDSMRLVSRLGHPTSDTFVLVAPAFAEACAGFCTQSLQPFWSRTLQSASTLASCFLNSCKSLYSLYISICFNPPPTFPTCKRLQAHSSLEMPPSALVSKVTQSLGDLAKRKMESFEYQKLLAVGGVFVLRCELL